jgi:hypothetical protein
MRRLHLICLVALAACQKAERIDCEGTATDTASSETSWEGLGCEDGRVRAVGEGPIGYSTLQGAIDASADGGVVGVCPGVHIETLDIPPALILTIQPAESDGATVQAPSGQRAISVQEGAELVLRGLTLLGPEQAPVEGSGGLIAVEEATLHLIHASLEGGSACGDGGAIAITTSTPSSEARLEVLDTTIRSSAATGNGGLLAATAAESSTIEVSVATSTLENGSADLSGGLISTDGEGAITLTITASTLSGGLAQGHGGTLAVLARPALVHTTLTDSVVSDSVAAKSGGHFFINSDERTDQRLFDGTDLTLLRSYAGAEGGAIRVAGFGDSYTELRGIFVEDCESVGRGGVLFMDGPELGEAVLSATLTAARNRSHDLTSAAIDIGLGFQAGVVVTVLGTEHMNEPNTFHTPMGNWNSEAEGTAAINCGHDLYENLCYLRVVPW